MKTQALEEKRETLVSIIVPVYNEAAHIEQSLRSITSRLTELSIDFELIVVESGSKDDSMEIVERISRADKRIKILHQEKREGMGSAIALGFSNARGDLFFWYDSDLPYDLSYLKKGIDMIGDADVVAGRRVSRHRPFKRRLYTAVFNALIGILYSPGVKDLNFAYKLFKRSVFEKVIIRSKSSFFAAEILIRCSEHGLKIIELDVPFEEDSQRKSRLGNLRTVFYVLKDMLAFMFHVK